MRKETPPCFYLFIYRKLKEKSNGSKVISHPEFLEIIGRNLNSVPRKYFYVILKELELFGLVRRVNQRKILIVGGNIDAKLDKFAHPLI